LKNKEIHLTFNLQQPVDKNVKLLANYTNKTFNTEPDMNAVILT